MIMGLSISRWIICKKILWNVGLERLVDIIDNVDSKKLLTNIFVLE